MGFNATHSGYITNFARIREGRLDDNEEARFDKPLNFANSFQYAGVALRGSATNAPVWSIIRVSYNSNGRKIREEFQDGVAWDDRVIIW